jgi:hypothetical protein
MHEDHFYDIEGTQGFMWMKGWRCLNCGYAVDPILEANRRLQQSARTVSPSDEMVISAASGPEHNARMDAEAA